VGKGCIVYSHGLAKTCFIGFHINLCCCSGVAAFPLPGAQPAGWAATESLQPLMLTFALFPPIQARLSRRILKRRINFALGTNDLGQRYNPKMVLSAGKAATSHSAGNTLGFSSLLLLEVCHKQSCIRLWSPSGVWRPRADVSIGSILP
jgi:hypothetical protein